MQYRHIAFMSALLCDLYDVNNVFQLNLAVYLALNVKCLYKIHGELYKNRIFK